MLKVLVAFFVLFILSVSSEDEESFSYRRMMYVSHLSVVFLSHPSSLPCFSETAWDGLEKPVGTLEGQSFAQCSQKCSDLGENCGLFHSNRGLQTCTPAKVWTSSLVLYGIRLLAKQFLGTFLDIEVDQSALHSEAPT